MENFGDQAWCKIFAILLQPSPGTMTSKINDSLIIHELMTEILNSQFAIKDCYEVELADSASTRKSTGGKF